MTLRDDVNLLRKTLEARWEAPHQALNRIEQALDLPKVAERGFYQYYESGMFYADGDGNWFDVPKGYKRTDYPDHLLTEELVRLIREDGK